jgi:hypothetical protein
MEPRCFCSSSSALTTRRAAPGWRRLALAAALAAGCLGFLGACAEPAIEELSGPIGAGEGGPAVNLSVTLSHPLTDPGGGTIGELSYDGSAFLHYHPDPASDGLHVLANIPPEQLLADLADDGELNRLSADNIVIVLTRIVGRPDTPCRFQAALLARDRGYEILAAGDRRNDQGLGLHQVNLVRAHDSVAQRFYCAQLRDPFGIQINVFTADEAHQVWQILHHVLNTLAKR